MMATYVIPCREYTGMEVTDDAMCSDRERSVIASCLYVYESHCFAAHVYAYML